MLEVSRAVADGDFQQVLDRVAAAARSVIRDATATSIVLTGRQLRMVAHHGLSSRYVDAIAADPSILRDGAAASAIVSGRTVWIDNMLADPKSSRVRALALAEGIVSFVAVPLRTLDQVVGALSVYRSTSGSWSDDEVALLQFFAQHAAEAVKTTRLLAERRDQIEGLTRVVEALRAQTHEHANRLHAVHGLIRLGEVGEAEAFLSELLSSHRAASAEVSRSIRIPALAGLLTAMIGTAAHRGVRLDVDPDSHVEELPESLGVAQLISLVGNLLDNALDAVADLEADRRRVDFFIGQDPRRLRIEVVDHGPGLPEPIDVLRRRGVSSKPDHAGVGLDAVWTIVEDRGGEVTVLSDDAGAQFVVVFPVRLDLADSAAR